MSSKTSFHSVIKYGFEIIIANLSLLAFSALVGGILSLWIGELLPSEVGLISTAGGFMFFRGLTYTLFLPALIYKVIADGVAKGLELDNIVERDIREVDSEEFEESSDGLDPDNVELQDHHGGGNVYDTDSDNNAGEKDMEQFEDQRIQPLYVLGLLVAIAIFVQILVSI